MIARLTVQARVSKLHTALSMRRSATREQTVVVTAAIRADFTNDFLIYYTTMQPDPPSGSLERWPPKISDLDEVSCIVTTTAKMIGFTEIRVFRRGCTRHIFGCDKKLFIHPIFSDLYFFICCTLNKDGEGEWKQGGLRGGASTWLLWLSLILGRGVSGVHVPVQPVMRKMSHHGIHFQRESPHGCIFIHFGGNFFKHILLLDLCLSRWTIWMRRKQHI